MYLKSLTLRGFKSFADKVTLKLEPGITAIVGPNGSGKSNISDAVLWVLGERNAKNLRGQAMEDVIFSGSSARKATSMAEVELVLDNSDGTLPMDFQEVSVARRVYRSGESEYLINGAVARRIDVLEILHDSGLGTGTHSIISQGALDSVLRSKPEDRRALIEEAAGVLKHKQRMAKSVRKLERMQAHVDRVSDIANEVGRQLGPLERKAKRAIKHSELTAELAKVKLSLAVDDLRNLRAEHGRITEREGILKRALDERKLVTEKLDADISALQAKILEDSQDANALSKSYQQVTSVTERLDSSCMLIRDRRRAAIERASEVEVQMEQAKGNIERAHARLMDARQQADSAASATEEASKAVDARAHEHKQASDALQSSEKRNKELMHEASQLESAAARHREELAIAKEALSNSMAQIKVMEGHKAELTLQVDKLSADAASAQEEAVAQEEALATLDAQEKEARNLVGSCMQAREEARRAADEASAQERSLETQIQALREIEASEGRREGTSAAQISEALAEQGSQPKMLSHALRAPEDLEGLVEALLKGDLSSLVVKGAGEVLLASSSIQGEEADPATLVMEDDPARHMANLDAQAPEGCTALMSLIKVQPAQEQAVRALLGDVMICNTLEQAIACHAEDAQGLRFATKSGDVVWPSGKVSLRIHAQGQETGVLSRLRRIDELKRALEEAKASSVRAAKEAEAAEAALMRAQTESLDIKERLASLKGSAHSARLASDAATAKLASVTRELEGVEAVLEKESSTADEARPNIQELERKIEEATAAANEAKELAQAASEELPPLRVAEQESAQALSDAKLELAKLTERSAYAKRVIDAALAELERMQQTREESAQVLNVKRVSAERLAPLLTVMDAISQSARLAMVKLEDAHASAKSSTGTLHEEMASLRKQAREAQEAYDKAAEELSAVQVERARAEMSVQAAVAVITEECAADLETALLTPELQDRPLAEEEAFKLTRRIANLGTINPDAAAEYEELKGRHDYLEGQLSDMRSAARALMRINAVIEERMRDDFANTFKTVDENFRQIFSMLFPGGNAHLSLVDPDDIEASGVEVHAQPAGKRIAKMSLMSGGERSLTALALLFALYKTRSTPFYILDEVEAALDDSNLRRLISYIDQMRHETQLLMITHQRRTMEMADVLFGVSMQADGVTKVLSQKLEDALSKKR
ncbi:MAG: chromosome segregation protein SMC [Eggerthellaceae bacterium]|nr:chromosome segregation protein SMC [Eggerthellaceae bacterium]